MRSIRERFGNCVIVRTDDLIVIYVAADLNGDAIHELEDRDDFGPESFVVKLGHRSHDVSELNQLMIGYEIHDYIAP